MTTDRDIWDHVVASLGDHADDFDIQGIVRELVGTYDLTGDAPRDTVDGIESTTYWAIVERHDRA